MKKWINVLCTFTLVGSMCITVMGHPQPTKAANESMKVNVNGNVLKWLLDEPNHIIYAITNTNKLLFTNTDDLTTQTVDLPGVPVDIDAYNGKLYITTSGAKIIEVDIASKSVELDKTLYIDADNIAIDDNKMFILKGDQWVTLNYYDLTTGKKAEITNFSPDRYQKYYNPNLVVDPATHTLYIGESGLSGSNLFALSTQDFSPISKSNYDNNYGFPNAAKMVTLGQNHVYYAGMELDSKNLEQITGNYNIPHDPILFVQGNDVFSNHALFDRFSNIKVKDLPTSTLNVMEDTSRNLYLASANQIEKTTYDEFINPTPPPTDPGTGTGTTDPGTGTTDPGTTDPGTGTTDPGTTDPGTGTTDPGTTDPGTGTTDPGTTDPGTGTTDPGTTDPGTGTTDPGTTDPGTGTIDPGAGTTDTEPAEPGPADLPGPVEAYAIARNVDLTPFKPTDIGNSWAVGDIQNFINSGLISGYKEGNGTYTARPENNITRAEVVAILVRALNLKSSKSGVTFSDVKSGEWYYEPIRIASSLGIVHGKGSGIFEPDSKITRAELATMIILAFGNTIVKNGAVKVFGDVPSDYWAKPYINDATKAGIISGYPGGLFKPNSNATRAEAIKMLSVALTDQQSNLPDDTTLINIVTNQFNDMFQLFTQGNWTGQYDKIAATSMGYDFVNTTDTINTLGKANNTGYSYTAEKTGDISVTVTQKSDTFAILHVTGVARNYTFANSMEGTFGSTSPNSYNVYLKLDPKSGQFKIYWKKPLISSQDTDFVSRSLTYLPKIIGEYEKFSTILNSSDRWSYDWYQSLGNEAELCAKVFDEYGSALKDPSDYLSLVNNELMVAFNEFTYAFEDMGNAMDNEDNNLMDNADFYLSESMKGLNRVMILLSLYK